MGCGVLRGSARPAIGARINLGSFYFLGTPVALALAFWLKIGFGGLWYGLLVAQFACAFSILFVVLRTDWQVEAMKAMQLTGGHIKGQLQMGYANHHNKEDANHQSWVDLAEQVLVMKAYQSDRMIEIRPHSLAALGSAIRGLAE